MSDERAAYFRSNGLVAYARDAPFWPRNKWIENGIQARAEGPRVLVYCCNGMFGYAAGPSVHIVDSLGLGDPLLARLPAEKGWRVGHFGRAVPRGYVETLETGANRIAAPFIAAYYSRLSIITRGPLWDRRRLLTILRMNLGTYESLNGWRCRADPRSNGRSMAQGHMMIGNIGNSRDWLRGELAA